MEDLVFSTFIRELKAVWSNSRISNQELIQLLYDSVSIPAELLNKNNEPILISKSQASKIVNRETGGNPNKSIKDSSSNKIVLNSINQYFETKIVKHIHLDSKSELIHKLMLIIGNDYLLSPEMKSKLSKVAQKNTLAIFLAKVYLYTLRRENVLTEKKHALNISNDFIQLELDLISPPSIVDKKERDYTRALFEIYGQKEKLGEFSENDLEKHPKYKKHFIDQRLNYFTAASVQRGTRDIYSDESQFEILKEETYEGIIEVWEDNYKDGFTRLRKVLSKSTNTQIHNCILIKDTNWISGKVKKGICHFLVNEQKLMGWKREDDEDF